MLLQSHGQALVKSAIPAHRDNGQIACRPPPLHNSAIGPRGYQLRHQTKASTACAAQDARVNDFIKSSSKDIFGGAENLDRIDLQQAEKLYLSLPERSNDKHTFLVLYSPTCSYCKGMEEQVRLLASGLATEADSLSIQALNCSTPAARYFVKHVLGMPAVPSFCIFPKQSRTFYKYKGTSRDAESLLKFLNMVCNQNEEKLWGLPSPESTATSVVDQAPLSAALEQHVTVSVEPESAPPARLSSVTSNGLLAVGMVAVLALFAALVDRARKQQDGVVEVAPAPAPASGVRPIQQLLSDIDSTIGRMAGLMLRLVRARLGLFIAPADDASVAVAGGASAASPSGGTTVEVVASSSASSSRPLPPGTPLAGGGRLGGPTVASAAVIAIPISAGSDMLDQPPSSSSQPSGWPVAPVPAPRTAKQVSAAPSPPPAPIPPPPSPRQALDMALKMQATVGAGSYLAADQVLALLDEEGDDVGKVVDRLMKQ